MADDARDAPAYQLRTDKPDGGFALQPSAHEDARWKLQRASQPAAAAPVRAAAADPVAEPVAARPMGKAAVAPEHLAYVPAAATRPSRPEAPGAAPPPAAQAHAAPHLLAPFRGAGAAQRVAALRRELAAAVDTWWRSEQLPGDDLLRDGLLALEAGHKLEETQLTLLARTALARGHGIHTALRHLGDADRAASLLHEALNARQLGPEELRTLLHSAPGSRDWAPQLATLASADLGGALPTADRAQTILQVLASDARAPRKSAPPLAATLTVDDQPERRTALRPLLAALLLLVLGALLVWELLARAGSDTIAVPAGRYAVTAADGSQVRVELAAFEIDRTEVTRRAWAQCAARGGCAALAAAPAPGAAVETPVTSISQAEAEAYCATLERRLPTAAEWEVAARWAPTTARNWRYPWGDVFRPAFVVSAATHSQLAAVASRSPQGDSPLGAADMAGNAAEWTSTPFAAPPDGRIDSTAAEPALAIVVRGGSFRDSTDGLQSAASASYPAGAREPWLGFRCAAPLAE